MGLDALDLAFRLEKQFGITVSPSEALAVLFDTPGTVHRYLVAKLRGEYRSAPCIEPLFKEVVKAVDRIAGRWRFCRSFDLNKCLSSASRAERWQALQKALGVSLPPLEYRTDEQFPRVPRQCDTIASLVHWIVEHHPERVQWVPVSCQRTGEMAANQWTEEEVWTILRESISGALGINVEDVTYDARMVEDLGMD